MDLVRLRLRRLEKRKVVIMLVFCIIVSAGLRDRNAVGD